MSVENSFEIFVTFLLAIIGYVGLTVILIVSLKGKIPFNIWRIFASIIVIHVIMVWIFRYQWSFSQSVRNGYGGFLIFHSALTLIILSALVKENISKILIRLSFVIVTMGAVGAVFRYDIVAVYKIPVLICAISGSAALFYFFVKKKFKLH
jgi:hypothetical protein